MSERKSVSFRIAAEPAPAPDEEETEQDAVIKKNTAENKGILKAKAIAAELNARSGVTSKEDGKTPDDTKAEKSSDEKPTEKVTPKEEQQDSTDIGSPSKPPPPLEEKPKPPPMKGALKSRPYIAQPGPSARSLDIRSMAEQAGSQMLPKVGFTSPNTPPKDKDKNKEPKAEKKVDDRSETSSASSKKPTNFNMKMGETTAQTDLFSFMRDKVHKTPSEEFEEISAILKEDVAAPGSDYYLLTSRWWNLWQLYVQPGKGINRPPEINNRHLLISDHDEFVKGEKPFYRLKNNLTKAEYQIIPEAAWRKLNAWYGGGPAIARSIVSRGIAAVTLFVELYPLHLRIMKVEHEEIRRFDFSQVSLAKELRKKCSASWSIPPAKCHLFLHQTELTHTDNLNKTLEELGVQDYQVILMRGGEQFTQLNSKRHGFTEVELRNNLVDEEGAPTVPGAVGIVDMGNTSYMNAALQCLMHISEFRGYFTGDFSKDINMKNQLGMKGELANALGDLVQLFYSGKVTKTAPLKFKAVFGKSAPQFSGAARQDIMEFLTFLLNGVHEDLKKVIPLMGIESSKITDLFQGQLKSKWVCGECGSIHEATDPFMSLSLPIPSKNERLIKVTLIPSSAVKCDYGVTVSKTGSIGDIVDKLRSLSKVGNVRVYFEYDGKEWLMNETDGVETIPRGDQLFAYEVDASGKVRGRDDGIPSNQHPSVSDVIQDSPTTLLDCYEKFTNRQTLGKGDWVCPKCEKEVSSATLKKTVEISPEILVLSPDRFLTLESYQDKIATPITFPDQLELPTGERYELLNFACHRGAPETGKFIAYAKCGDSWFEFEDAEVRPWEFNLKSSQIPEDVIAMFYHRSAAPAAPAEAPTKGPRQMLRTMSRTTSMGNVNQYAPPRTNLIVASPVMKRDKVQASTFGERFKQLMIEVLST
eukprot:TRINITY_DN2025_c0_g1_i3.p1 TRINITY_DN2025_c0_g1~~TRINITY_DN2025_c0_g1_i3.p1  ORF type:complete len:941 (+),score=341.09 TRINITY_DN2025_c0_g1_i3:46-2823(+)